MTDSKPRTLDDYIEKERKRLFEIAQREAYSWNSVTSGFDPGYSTVARTPITLEKNGGSVAINREQYNVQPTYDAVLETINAAIENLAGDLTEPGVAGIRQEGLQAIRSAFGGIVEIRGDFIKNESYFATRKPEPVEELVPDSDGIVRGKYGEVLGRVKTGCQE